LRTPLNAILGFTRLVRRRAGNALPDRQIENLDRVLTSAEHLLGLINTILDIAKIEAGRMDVMPSDFVVAELIEVCVATSQPLLKPGVKLVQTITADLPAVYADQDKIKQILLNLLSNAAKFTHAGEIVVTVGETVGPSGNGADMENGWPTSSYLCISVADTGIGISAEALERIFEEFEQADSTTAQQYGGTGLGLAISRKLARLLGGDLTATSVRGEGSTFTLVVPLRSGEPISRA
jgi:signal transduction histidine kinase